MVLLDTPQASRLLLKDDSQVPLKVSSKITHFSWILPCFLVSAEPYTGNHCNL